MSAEPSQSFPHNTLWRKLRRRYFFDRFSLFGGLFSLPPALCGITWLCHGPGWLTFCWGALWFLTSVFMMFVMTMSLKSRIRKGVDQRSSVPMRLYHIWFVLMNGATIIALLMGRVDWAFYTTFGLSGLSGWWGGGRPVRLPKALNVVLELSLCLAFALHAVWMVVALLILQLLRPWRLKLALPEAIRLLPTRAEYVARSREACAAGGG